MGCPTRTHWSPRPSAALIFVGELARVTLLGDRQYAPIALAAALGYALIFSMGTDAGQLERRQCACRAGRWPWALLLCCTGSPVGRPTSPCSAGSSSPSRPRAAVFHQLVVAHRPGSATRPSRTPWCRSWSARSRSAAAVDLLRRLGHRALHQRHRAQAGPARRGPGERRPARRRVARPGVLIALSAHLMGWWALPVLVLPLLTTQFSFRRYAQIRSTYRQTIRALSKITEVGGYVQDGHSIRVSALAVADRPRGRAGRGRPARPRSTRR